MEYSYCDDEILNMTMIKDDTTEDELQNSKIYIMMEQMYHFICVMMLFYIYTSIVYEVFKKDHADTMVEVNNSIDLQYETQEIMKENISKLQYKIGKMRKTIQKFKKQTKNKNKKILEEISKLELSHEDNA